jgi:hypothetical protein
MLIQNRQGTRFELVIHPTSAVPTGVPIPYAGPEAFLSSFTPAQRAEMLRQLGGNARFPTVDYNLLRNLQNDALATATLVRLVRSRQIAFSFPDGGARRQVAAAAPSGAASQPAAPPPPPPRQAVREEVVCELMAAEISCAHKGRKANRAGLLEVVPGRDDDRIKLEAQLRGGCGKHPKWEITAPGASEAKTGASASFTARNWGFKLLGIFEVMPKSYYVNVGCCSGMSRRFEVKTYPIDEWSITANIDFKKPPTQWVFEAAVTPWEDTGLTLKSGILKALTDRKTQLDYVLDKMLKPLLAREPEWEFFKTKLNFKGKWAESEKDHRCYYNFEASLALDPLIKGTFTIPFGPTSAIPPWIKKWTTDLIGDLYLYVRFSGEVGLKGKWSRTGPDTSGAEASGTGKVGVKVGGNLFLMKRGALNLDVNGGTEIVAEVTAPVQRKPAVSFDLKWGGIEVELTIEAAWGMVEYKRKWKAVEGGSFFKQPKVWHPLGEGV